MKNENQKAKIMVVTPYFPPHTGGVQNYVYHIATGLQKSARWDVVAVTSKPDIKKVKVEQRDGLKIYYLPVAINVSNTPINPLWFFQLKLIMHREKPSLINAHAPVPFMADMAALAAGSIPFVLSYHTGSMVKGKNGVDKLILFYEKYVLPKVFQKAKTIICSSDFVKNTFLRSFSKKTITINPGVDIVAKKPSKKDTNNVLFVGGLTKAEHYKGVEYLIKAIALLKKDIPTMQLSVAGKGDAMSTYKQLAKQLGIAEHVRFLGRQDKNALQKLYQRANVLVLPSASESFGMVLIEAMSHGTPVIASNIGGIPDVVTDGKEGILVPVKNAEKLAAAIKKILTNKTLADKLGQAGYEKVKERYLWDIQIAKTKEVFEKYL
jgi:rhamnosyl/mannosyltransferase